MLTEVRSARQLICFDSGTWNMCPVAGLSNSARNLHNPNLLLGKRSPP
jgi:hypothetical protein